MKFPFSYSLKYLQNSIYAVYTFLPHLLRKSFQPQKRQILRSPPCFGVFANFKVLKICTISINNSRISTNYTLIFKQFTFFNNPYTILVSIELCRLLRLRCGRSYADSAKGTRPSGLPFPDAAVNACDYRRSCVLLRPANRMVERRGGKFL